MPNPMISPGVRVNVVDESQYTGLAGESTNPICIVGAAQKGPTMEPTLLTSTTQFLNTFGTPIDMAGLTATKSLSAGGTIYYVRLADGSEQVKTVTLPGADSSSAVTYQVEGVTVQDGGSNYTVGDVLSTINGDTPATFKVISTDGAGTTYSVSNVTIVGGGSNYVVGDKVSISTATGTAAEMTVDEVNAAQTTWQITSATVASGGSGYAIGDTLTVQGTPSDATFTVSSVNSTSPTYSIATAEVVNGGSGYTENDTLTIAGSTDATITVNSVSSHYSVPAATISEAGTGYTENDEVTLTGNTGDTPATAKVTAVGTNGEITTLEIESGGSYQSEISTAVNIAGGTGSGATAILNFNQITGVISTITVTVPGSFATDVAGDVTPAGGTGSGATFKITTTANTYGVVTGVNLVNGGSFVTDPQGESTPTTSGSGSGVALNLVTAQIAGGVITKLTLTEGGEYATNPAGDSVSLTGGSGSGATVKVETEVDTTGGVTSLSVDTPGAFSTDPSGEGITLTGGTGSGIKVNITSKEIEVPIGGANLVLTATSAGTLAEGTWYAVVTGAAENEFTLQIIRIVGTNDPITVVSPTKLSLISTDSNYYTTFTGNGMFTLQSDSTEDPKNLTNSTGFGFELSKGSNGVTPDDPDANIPAITQAIDVLSDPESFNFMYITLPMYSTNAAVATQLVSLAKTRDQSIVQIDHLPSVKSVDDIVKAFTGLAGPTNSQIALWGGLNLVSTDEYNNNAQIPVPPSVVIIPALAELYSSSDPWTPPASVNNLVLSQLRSATSFSQSQRDTLYAANINPITNYRGLGWTSMGQKTAQTKLSALDRLNVRQLINNIKRKLALMSVDFLFSPIDQQTFDNWTYRANQILAQIAQRRGLYDYKVKLDFETTSQDDINNNIMRPIVQVKPSKVAEYVDIDLIIRNYSDEWNP